MAIYYASVGFTSDPDNQQIIPVGGMRELKFPRNEQRDPWGMHALPGGLFRMPVNGVATIQLDVYWSLGQAGRRHAINGDEQPYEGTYDTTRADVTWTHHTTVRNGEILGVGVRHDSATPQSIVAARIQIMINDDVAIPTDRRTRIRVGTNPEGPDLPEGPPNVGDGIAQPPFDPEGPNV